MPRSTTHQLVGEVPGHAPLGHVLVGKRTLRLTLRIQVDPVVPERLDSFLSKEVCTMVLHITVNL